MCSLSMVLRKLGRDSAHRRALFRNLVTSLIKHDRIKTTLPKAKEIKPIADKMVTLAKKGTLTARRQAIGYLFEKEVASKLMDEMPQRFADRQGGYTRLIRIPNRRGDNAPMAMIEYVDAAMQIHARKLKEQGETSASASSSTQGQEESLSS